VVIHLQPALSELFSIHSASAGVIVKVFVHSHSDGFWQNPLQPRKENAMRRIQIAASFVMTMLAFMLPLLAWN
jgi:hypothetical protein